MVDFGEDLCQATCLRFGMKDSGFKSQGLGQLKDGLGLRVKDSLVRQACSWESKREACYVQSRDFCPSIFKLQQRNLSCYWAPRPPYVCDIQLRLYVGL